MSFPIRLSVRVRTVHHRAKGKGRPPRLPQVRLRGGDGELPQINPAGKSPSDYDLVIVGTLVWSKKMLSPVRSYLSQHRDKIRDVAFFCTLGGSEGEATIKAMADLVGKEAKASVMFYQKEIEDGGYSSKVEEFAVELSSAG